jgi:hypothetical protein
MNFELAFTCPDALAAIQEIPRWVIWGVDEDNPKRPYTPGNGSPSPASTDDPSTWATYEDATETAGQLNCGIGLVLSPANDEFDIVAFDLDNCRDAETGELVPWAEDLVEEAGSYTEITPSGMGLRIIGVGSDVELHCDLPRDDDGHLEVYSRTNRYITVTGNRLGGSSKTLSNLSELVVQHRDENLAGQLAAAAQTRSFDDRKIERLVNDLGRPGKWHNAMVRLVGHFVSKGETDSAIQAIARPWTQPGFTTEQTKAEVQIAIGGARRKGFDRAARGELEPIKADGLKFYSLEELANEPPPEMLIEGIFPERGVAIIYGASGSMKSFLMIALGMHVAFGLDLDGAAVKQRPVLFLLNEGQAGFSLRCEAWLKENGEPRPENLRIAKMTPHLPHDSPNDQFIELAEEMNFSPGLIVIDSFSKATLGSDDNSTSDMAWAMANAERLAAHFNALVVLVDHVGKDKKKGVRGAYAKVANTDMVGEVSKSDTRVTLATIKQKEAEADLMFIFRTAMVEMPVLNDKKHSVPALVLDTDPSGALVAAFTQPGWILDQLGADGPQTRKQLKQEFCEVFGENRAKNFNEVIRRLKKDGKIKEDEDGFALAE